MSPSARLSYSSAVTEIRDQRVVNFEDPSEAGGWVMVIVDAPTGVRYSNQTGGYACHQSWQEGYLLPVFGAGLDEELALIFAEELRGHGYRPVAWSPSLLDRLRAAVADVAVYGAQNRDALYPTPLVLDERRVDETEEAWVRVLTPDGPGVLVWQNSD